jgi:hypothetical protein
MKNKQRKSLSELLWGSPEAVSLKNRIVNAIWFQLIVCVIFATITNIILNNPVDQTVGSSTALFLAAVSYVSSRFFKIFFYSNIIGIIGFLGLIAIFWFSSGGMIGSWPYTLFILMVTTIIIGPSRYKLLIIVLQFFVFFSLIFLEFLKPSWVVHYHSYRQQFFDMAIFLFMSLLVVTTIVHIVFLQYIREKEANERLLAQTIKDKNEIEKAFLEINQLQGIIPICSSCKRVRNDKGYWEQVEQYIHEHSEAKFSHGFCPECIKKLYNKEVPPSMRDSPS